VSTGVELYYVILSDPFKSGLESQVNDLMKRGYAPVGGVSFAEHLYIQAVYFPGGEK
jgi:hypothetical protein